jgi:glutamyl-tRNA synthetase
LNHLALIGWNPGTKQEIMTKDEMISLFSLERVNNSSAMFDTLKLNDFNSIYMRSREHALLWNKYIWPHIANHDCYNKELWKIIVDLAKERSVLAKDLYKSVSYFFETISIPDDVVIKNPLEFKTVMSDFIKNVDSVVWDSDSISNAMNTISDNYGFKHNKILPDLRMALTGGQSGPLLSLTMEVLGKEDSVHRIENLIKYIKVAE